MLPGLPANTLLEGASRAQVRSSSGRAGRRLDLSLQEDGRWRVPGGKAGRGDADRYDPDADGGRWDGYGEGGSAEGGGEKGYRHDQGSNGKGQAGKEVGGH